eukprot:Pgem_evm2s147
MESCKKVETSTNASKKFSETVGTCSVTMKGGASANVVCGGAHPVQDLLNWKQTVINEPTVVDTDTSEMKWLTTLLDNDYVGKQQFIDQTFAASITQSKTEAYAAFVANVKTHLQAYLKGHAVCDVYNCPKEVPVVLIQNKDSGNFLGTVIAEAGKELHFINKANFFHTDPTLPLKAMWYYLPQHEMYINYQDPTLCMMYPPDQNYVLAGPCKDVWDKQYLQPFKFKIDHANGGWLTHQQNSQQTNQKCVREATQKANLTYAQLVPCDKGVGLSSFQHLPVLQHKNLFPNNADYNKIWSNMKNITLAYNGTSRYTMPWVPDSVSFL